MATSLTSNDNSHDQELENILTNRKDTIMTIVEDESDVAIWKDILLSVWPQKKFRVSPFSYGNNGKGKSGILKKSSEFGPYMIGCIDSDYDWILDGYTDDSRIISSNKYILQTVAYGVENLLLQPVEVASCVRTGVAYDSDILDSLDDVYYKFIETVSKIIYQPLLWHFVRIKSQVDVETLSSDWDNLFSGKIYNMWVGNDQYTCEEIWKSVIIELQNQSETLTKVYEEKYASLKINLQSLEEELKHDRNLTEENAYLFAPAHQIFDFISYAFFEPLEKRLKSIHIQEIDKAMPLQARQNAHKHYYNECMPFKKLRKRKYSFINNFSNHITDTLKHDVFMRLQ